MKKLIFAAVILVFLLSSCSLLPFGKNNDNNAAVAALQATRDAQNAAATASGAQAQQAPTQAPPTEAPTIAPPTETPTVVPPTATPTEVPMVKAVANVNANCRFGPDKSFANDELLNAGASTVVIGQVNTNGQWWKVTTADGKECWVLGDNVTITGDTSTVAMLVSPNTPTPVPPPSWAGDYVALCSGFATDPEKNAMTVNATIYQTGNQIKTNFVCYGFNVQIIATVSQDGMFASGEMQYGYNGYVVRLARVASNLNQFQGKFYAANNPGYDGAFCGGTKGSSYPSPCRP